MIEQNDGHALRAGLLSNAMAGQKFLDAAENSVAKPMSFAPG